MQTIEGCRGTGEIFSLRKNTIQMGSCWGFPEAGNGWRWGETMDIRGIGRIRPRP